MGERGAHYAAYKEYIKVVIQEARKKRTGWLLAPSQYENDSLNFSVFTVVTLVATAYVIGQLRGQLRK